MIKKEITDFIIRKTGIKAKELVEKDVLLNQLLFHLASDKHFFENYALKGGTCLIKCYLGYYRFSEDLDFTYLNQKEFAGKSEKQIRALISDKIDRVALIIEKIAKSLDLRFKTEKHNREYFQFGGSNAFVTFKLWYNSLEQNKETFIKVQINYRENLNYSVKIIDALSLLMSKGIEKDFLILFPEESKILLKPIKIKAYDSREILTEKIRAILTRRGVKARDFIDVYKTAKSENIKIEELKQQIISKTKDTLRFEKYQINLDRRQMSDFSFDKTKEDAILFTPLDKDFDSFLDKFKLFLQELIKEI